MTQRAVPLQESGDEKSWAPDWRHECTHLHPTNLQVLMAALSVTRSPTAPPSTTARSRVSDSRLRSIRTAAARKSGEPGRTCGAAGTDARRGDQRCEHHEFRRRRRMVPLPGCAHVGPRISRLCWLCQGTPRATHLAESTFAKRREHFWRAAYKTIQPPCPKTWRLRYLVLVRDAYCWKQ